MMLEKYLNSTTGWLEDYYIYTYCLGEYTWHGIRQSGEPTMFQLHDYLFDPSYSIDIVITNNDTENALERIPDLIVLINGQDVRLDQICPDAYNYYMLNPEESVALTATLDNMQFGSIFSFGIDTQDLWGSTDFSVSVVSSDIFTGWLQRGNYTDIRVYDNGIWTS